MGLLLAYGAVTLPSGQLLILAFALLCAGVYWSAIILLIGRFLRRHTPDSWYPVPILSRWFAPRASYRLLWVALGLVLLVRELPLGPMFDLSFFFSTNSLQLATHDSFHRTSASQQFVRLAQRPVECHTSCADPDDATCQLVRGGLCPARTIDGERAQLTLRIEVDPPFCYVPLFKLHDTEFRALASLN